MNTSSFNESTYADSEKCRFKVDFFSYVADDGSLHSNYPGLSNQAHIVLGIGMFLIVMIWSSLVFGWIKDRHTIYMLVGGVQITMGVYLLFWVFIILHPSDLGILFTYSTSDLLQLEHISIALLLISAGICELSYRRWKDKNWHIVWCLNVFCVGIVFLIHPQHNASAITKHIFLGSLMIFSSFFLMLSKKEAFCSFQSDSKDIDPMLLTSASGFTVVGFLLCSFREEPRSYHFGYIRGCNGIWPLICTTYIFSLGTTIYAVSKYAVEIKSQKIGIQSRKKRTITKGKKYSSVPTTIEFQDMINESDSEDDHYEVVEPNDLGFGQAETQHLDISNMH